MDTVPAEGMALSVYVVVPVHPAQRTRPAIRRPDRMQICNGDIALLSLQEKNIKDSREEKKLWQNPVCTAVFRESAPGLFLCLLKIGNHPRQPGHPLPDLVL
jgi:hypothetical protein